MADHKVVEFGLVAGPCVDSSKSHLNKVTRMKIAAIAQSFQHLPVGVAGLGSRDRSDTFGYLELKAGQPKRAPRRVPKISRSENSTPLQGELRDR